MRAPGHRLLTTTTGAACSLLAAAAAAASHHPHPHASSGRLALLLLRMSSSSAAAAAAPAPAPRRVTIVGAGISGLTCARTLLDSAPSPSSLQLTLLEKSTSHGRCATRAVPALGDAVTFDHGAPGFAATDPAFRAQVGAWVAEGAVAPFGGTEAGSSSYFFRGQPTMRSLPLHLAKGLDIRRPVLIERVVARGGDGGDGDGGAGRPRWALYPQGQTDGEGEFFEADALVVAVPPEQSAALLAGVRGAEALHAAISGVKSDPCITVMLAVPADAAAGGEEEIVTTFPEGAGGSVLAKAVRRRRGGFDCWVAHTTKGFTERYIYTTAEAFEKQVVLDAVLAAMRAAGLVGGDVAPAHMDAQRWLYSQTDGSVLGKECGWEPALQLGVCGDGWAGGTEGRQGVERAWLSGRALGAAMARAWWGEGKASGGGIK